MENTQLTLAGNLPGVTAHMAMVPPTRRGILEKQIVPEDARQAAVLALLVPPHAGLWNVVTPEWRVLLTRRAVYNGPHSGQISFPGGGREDVDADLWDTALRETNEEVGITLDRSLGHVALSPYYIPISNALVQPFAACLAGTPAFHPDKVETITCKWVPLGMLNPALALLADFPSGNLIMTQAPYWQVEDYRIWGATAMILSELYTLVVARALLLEDEGT